MAKKLWIPCWHQFCIGQELQSVADMRKFYYDIEHMQFTSTIVVHHPLMTTRHLLQSSFSLKQQNCSYFSLVPQQFDVNPMLANL
jgi:hypothetical protein